MWLIYDAMSCKLLPTGAKGEDGDLYTWDEPEEKEAAERELIRLKIENPHRTYVLFEAVAVSEQIPGTREFRVVPFSETDLGL